MIKMRLNKAQPYGFVSNFYFLFVARKKPLFASFQQ